MQGEATGYAHDRPLAGQHAVVTGASRGIGAASARRLAELGADVTLVGRVAGALEEIIASLPQGGPRYFAHAADVSDEAVVERAFAAAVEALGAPSILVTSAGIGKSTAFHRETTAEWREILGVNLDGVFYCVKQVYAGMRERGYGRIVNVASLASLEGRAYMVAYCASKHGVLGFTRALALEGAKAGVTVNAVCPGWTDTKMVWDAIDNVVEKTGRTHQHTRDELAGLNPHGRFVTPAEVAETVAWLCLPASGSVNGQAIAVSGGPVTG